jgi:hypothetical protein
MARSAGLLIIVVLLGAGLAAAKSQSRSSSQGRPAASRSGAKIKAAGKRTAKTRPTITVRPVAARQPMAKDELDQRESGEGTDDVQAEPELPDPQENSLNIQEPEILDPDVPFDDRRMYITPDEIRRRIRPLRGRRRRARFLGTCSTERIRSPLRGSVPTMRGPRPACSLPGKRLGWRITRSISKTCDWSDTARRFGRFIPVRSRSPRPLCSGDQFRRCPFRWYSTGPVNACFRWDTTGRATCQAPGLENTT